MNASILYGMLTGDMYYGKRNRKVVNRAQGIKMKKER